ncbi:MAG: aminotransferase class I/II-fold pyridoxal phosphate-dependent enzyme [Gemmatimonadaceae bacterium]|nr:aminotransferase class I/II-fold pyridoxal phosphate-dependent enzyme [Gemmatimonadaceae bacterium]
MPTAIDLRSDTVTRPTSAMRRAMAEAEVGDDVLDGDPMVRRLEETVAALLGKPRGLFFPTGTMANQAALWLLGESGTEVYCHDDSHIVNWEIAGTAALAGLQVRVVRGAPVLEAEALKAMFRPASPHAPRASLVCAENTHNGAGGMVTPLKDLQRIRDVAAEQGLPLHLDGARLWNAHIATGTPLKDFAACAETVMCSFSKGLGAPVGATLVGSERAMAKAWEVRKRLGGGMRQSGILAAAALHGLEHHLPKLAEDHRRAKALASGLAEIKDLSVVTPDTNIVMVDLPSRHTAFDVVTRAREAGVLVTPWSATRIRAVLHLDVDDAALATALARLQEVLR